MRRLALVLVILGSCAGLVGCGGHDDKTVTPLDDAVGYFAKDAPFVAAIETDPDGDQIKQVTDLVGRFPGSDILTARLQRVARLPFLNWERDIRPELGAPLVVGLLRPAAASGLANATVAAMRVKHPLRAKQVLLR